MCMRRSGIPPPKSLSRLQSAVVVFFERRLIAVRQIIRGTKMNKDILAYGSSEACDPREAEIVVPPEAPPRMAGKLPALGKNVTGFCNLQSGSLPEPCCVRRSLPHFSRDFPACLIM